MRFVACASGYTDGDTGTELAFAKFGDFPKLCSTVPHSPAPYAGIWRRYASILFSPVRPPDREPKDIFLRLTATLKRQDDSVSWDEQGILRVARGFSSGPVLWGFQGASRSLSLFLSLSSSLFLKSYV